MRYFYLILGILFSCLHAQEECCNEPFQPCLRLEAAPTYAQIDVLENNHTVKKDHLYGARIDLTFPFPYYTDFILKPVILGCGGKNQATLLSATLNIGYLYDFNSCISIIPEVGFAYTQFHTKVFYPQFEAISIKENFYSFTVLVGGDIVYRFNPCWRFVGSAYYGFSRAKTHYQSLFTIKGNAGGPSFYGMIERDITPYYSVNFGGGYNGSFSEDKDGIRAWGLKLGLVRWF